MPRDLKPTRVAPGVHRIGAPRSASDGLVDDLKTFRHELLSTRRPSYHALLGDLIKLLSEPQADERLTAAFDAAWRTRTFPSFYERPLLILAALRFDALQEGPEHPLFLALAASDPKPVSITPEAVVEALGADRIGAWSALRTRRMQTNDTSRALAWLWPAFLAGCDQGARPLALVDIGASAGLNLIADALPPMWTERVSKKPLPTASRLQTVARLGFDARPLDFRKEQDLAWIRACVWPGEVDRLARLDAGILAMRAAAARPSPPQVELLSASLVPDRLAALVTSFPKGTLTLAYQTLVAGYLEPNERETYRAGMTQWVLSQPAGSALWIELEIDDGRRRLPAVLTAHARLADSAPPLSIARSSQHPTEVEVDQAGVAELVRRLTVPA